MEKWVNMFLDLIFPRRCPVCDEIVLPKGRLICQGCLEQLELVAEPVCKKCGKEITTAEAEYCYDCARTPHSFEHGWALANYTPLMKASIARFKYHNRREYAVWYGEALLRRYGRQILRCHPQLWIPVPVHPQKRRKRGFNQAEVLAGALSRCTGIPVRTGALVRKKVTAPQKELTPKERLKNLEQAFLADPDKLKGIRSVILVDDIYTTGSTIEACTRALKKTGVERVYFVSICIGKGY